MLSIHNNLSAGAYVIIMLVYRRLLTTYMTKQLCDSSVIANNAPKTQKLFIQGYNLEVHDVIKYTRKHHATVLN